MIHAALSSFLERLTPETASMCFSQATHGKTDFTLVCRNLTSEELPSKFILKFSTPCLNLSARVNSYALELLGLKTP